MNVPLERLSARERRVVDEVAGWPGVALAPHTGGGLQFRFGRGELGHLGPDAVLVVAFPKPVRDVVVSSGRAAAHPELPDSGWVAYTIRRDEDAPGAVELIRFAYDLRQEHAARAAHEPHEEELLDEALDETFPASDPPAIGGH